MYFNPLETLKIVNQFVQIHYPSKSLDQTLTRFLECRFPGKQFKKCLLEFTLNSGTFMVSTCGRHLFSINELNFARTITELEPVTNPSNNLRCGTSFSEFEVFLLTNGKERTNQAGFKRHVNIDYILSPGEYLEELGSTKSLTRRTYMEESYKTIVL